MADNSVFSHNAPYIKLVDCRNTLHVTLCQHRPPTEARIEHIDAEKYWVPSTGEIRFYEHGETGTKQDNLRSIQRAFNQIKKLVNCNYGHPSHVRFLTLTYKRNMQDNSRIRPDWQAFIRRVRANYRQDFRYLYVKERQKRGAWHLHAFLFFDAPAPYMKNATIRELWGHGFVSITAVKHDVNNLGNYLCAYLTDKPGKKSKKGARLLNYESGIRLYNCSRNIFRPEESTLTFAQYQALCKDNSLVKISSRDSVVSVESCSDLHYRYEMYLVSRNE